MGILSTLTNRVQKLRHDTRTEEEKRKERISKIVSKIEREKALRQLKIEHLKNQRILAEAETELKQAQAEEKRAKAEHKGAKAELWHKRYEHIGAILSPGTRVAKNAGKAVRRAGKKAQRKAGGKHPHW